MRLSSCAGSKVLKKEDSVLGGYSSKDYRAFRLWAESLAGVQVQPDNVLASLHGSWLS